MANNKTRRVITNTLAQNSIDSQNISNVFQRLVSYYSFECEGGPLANCKEYQDLRVAVGDLTVRNREALERALAALGGPVDSERPPQETIPLSVEDACRETMPGMVDSANPDILEGVIIGADSGDENDYDPRLELTPAEVDEYVAGLGDIDPK